MEQVGVLPRPLECQAGGLPVVRLSRQQRPRRTPGRVARGPQDPQVLGMQVEQVQVEQVVVVLSSVLLDLHTMNKVNYRNCSLLYV